MKKQNVKFCHICGSPMYSNRGKHSCPICGNEEQQKKPD